MKSLKERVAYIRGLAEGMEMDSKDPRNKLLLKVLDLLDEMVVELDSLDQRVEDNEDLVDALDEDLSDVEEFLFEEDEADLDSELDADLSEFEIQCPHCDEIVYVDEGDLAGAADDDLEILCPHCNQVIFSDEDEQGVLEGDEALPVD